MIRSRRWKLVHYKGESYGQLFDLDNDPGEVNDLWNDPAAAEPKAQLLASLREWLIDSNYNTRDFSLNWR
jgi:arylsulfatase A-like enzyme